jgi:hypothetical protein
VLTFSSFLCISMSSDVELCVATHCRSNSDYFAWYVLNVSNEMVKLTGIRYDGANVSCSWSPC